jgi:hypothetical protein
MARFEYSPLDVDVDRAYLLIDHVFDVHVLRTEEGLIVDVWAHERDLLGTRVVETPSGGEEYSRWHSRLRRIRRGGA